MRRKPVYSIFIGKASNIEVWKCFMGSLGCYNVQVVNGEISSMLTGAKRQAVSRETFNRLLPKVQQALANPKVKK